MNKPKLRFKGFTEDWEQRKLGETLKYEQPGAYIVDSTDYDDSYETPVLTARQSFILGYTNETDGIKNASHDNPVIIFDDFTTSSHFVDFPFKVKSSAMKLLTLKDESDDIYCINNILKNVDYVPASHERHWISIFSEFDVTIPHSKDEQRKIGDYFRNLDHLITLHQWKCEKSRLITKNDWEQRKFSDFTRDAGKRNKDNLDLVPYAITNEHGFIPQNEAHDEFGYMKDTDRRAYNIVEPKSFAYNPARINVGSLGYYEGSENVIVSSLYEVFKTAEYVDDRFLWHWLKSPELPKWIGKLQEGSVRLYFYYDKLCECILRMPSIDEQRKIAKYLDNLDHLITLHQWKCEKSRLISKNDWEQRKLGELGEIMTGSTPSTSKPEYYSEDGIPWVTPTDINALTISDTPKKLSEEGIKVGRVVPANTILCTCIASIGKNALLTVRGSFNQQINSLTPSAENDSYFLLTESELWSEKMKRMAASGTMQIVNKTEFSELITMVPSLNEQKIIGSYFHNLDHFITLHQWKCEKSRLISKNDWEQRKLGDIITEYKETVDSDCILPILTSSKTEGVILQEEHFGRKQQHDITGYNILPRNYCTYRNRSDGVDFTFNINKCCDKGIISKFYPVFSGKNSDVFFLSLVLNNSEEVVREIAYTCTGTGQKVLSFLDLQKMKVRVPNFDEQKEIAAYFESLDHLITLHQRKNDHPHTLQS